MKLLSSRCFLLVLISTHPAQPSFVVRELHVSTPSGNQQFDDDTSDESSTGYIRNETSSALSQTSMENVTDGNNDRFSDQTWKQTQTWTAQGEFDNSTITDPVPEGSTWTTTAQTGLSPGVSELGIEELTTQPVTVVDVEDMTTQSVTVADVEDMTTQSVTVVDVEDMTTQSVTVVDVEDMTTQSVTVADVEDITRFGSINDTSTSYIDSSITVSITDIEPTTEVRETNPDAPSTEESANIVEQTDETTSVPEGSIQVFTSKVDSFTMKSTTDDNLTKDSSGMHDSTETVEVTTVGSESSEAGNTVENTDVTESEEANTGTDGNRMQEHGKSTDVTWKRRLDQLTLVTTFLVITIGAVSLVLNILNIVIYSHQKTASVTFIIVLSAVDILESLTVISIIGTSLAVDINRNGWVYYLWVNFRLYLKQLSHTFNALISADRFFVIYKIWKSKNRVQEYPKTTAGIVAFILLVFIGLQAYTVDPSVDRSSTSSSQCHGIALVNSNTTTTDASNLNISLDLSTTDGPLPLDMTTPGAASVPGRSNMFIAFVFNIFYPYLTFLAIAVFNIATLVSLKRRAEERKRLNASTTTGDSSVQDRKQTVILLTMTTVYVLLSLPYALIRVFTAVKFSQEDGACWSSVLLNIALVSELVTTCSDFLVFLVVSRSFRGKLVTLFACRPRDGSRT